MNLINKADKMSDKSQIILVYGKKAKVYHLAAEMLTNVIQLIEGSQKERVSKIREVLLKRNIIIPLDDLKRIISAYTKVEDFFQPSQSRKLLYPRQLFIYCAYIYCGYDQKDIVKYIGGARDRTMVTYTVKVINDLIDTDEQIKGDVEALKSIVLNGK